MDERQKDRHEAERIYLSVPSSVLPSQLNRQRKHSVEQSKQMAILCSLNLSVYLRQASSL